MKPFLSAIGVALNLLILTGAASTAAAGDDLAQRFVNPPETAGPQTWWHWMSGNITKEGITADLEAMKRVGIHGAEIFNVSEGIPDGPAPFMSPQWLELFRFAAAEADRLGMELCFHNCAGWSSSGGPWIKPEHAMQTVVTSEIHPQGGTHFDAALPQPATKAGYYRDIAVLAFPTPTDGARVEKLGPKGLFGFDYEYGLQPAAKTIPAGASIPKANIVDLTSKLSADGKLAWDVPAGEWTILRIGHTPTGKDNHPAPEAGRGLECDKLSRQALDAHWAGGIDPILKKLGPLAGKSLNDCLIDSYEVGCNNWTPEFRAEFMKRRGYDPIPFLPALSGRYVESGEITERFLWDLRRTVGDLFAENYYGYFCDLCKQHGLMSSIEPYDGPFECLQVGAKASIVMGEFWAGGGESSSVKLAASVAHTHGVQIIGAESFTADPDNGKWLNHPGSLKALGDLTWCTGVNRFIFHCYAHQPWMDKAPAMTMGQWGTHFGRFNTWWEQSRAWISYITRSQYLLQQGRCAADVLFFGGEAAPNGGVHRPDLKDRGFDYDAIGTDLIPSLTVENGLIHTPAGGSYRVLVFPDTTWMTPALARRVGELAKAGATIIAPKPQKSPSLAGFPGCDAEVATLADEIWGATPGDHALGKGRLISNRSVEQVLADLKVQPDFAPISKESHMAFIHRVVSDVDLYFVSNQKTQPETVECAFRVTGRAPELWDAETGRITTPAAWRVQDGRTFVTLSLEQAGSAFVVFRTAAPAPADPIVQVTSQMNPKNSKPLPKLTITRALYGAFSLSGSDMVDVTDKLAERLQNGQLRVSGYNALAGDPAANVVKELRVEYELDGKARFISVPEGQPLILPVAGESGKVRIVRAIYGKFRDDLKRLPTLKSIDVTQRVASRISNNMLDIRIDNKFAGSDPALMVPKELHLDYALDGVAQSLVIKENQELRLPEDAWSLMPPEPRLSLKNGQLTLTSAEAASLTATTASGTKKSAVIDAVPELIEVTGPWEVTFPAGRGAPPKATLDKLISWPAHTDAGIKYFSGTATYHKTITIPVANLASGRSVELDLGRVDVIAEVRLNGKELGILWKAPFRIDLGDSAKSGDNDLEIRVTNLWPNRLIGDEQFADDCEWNGITIKRWPDWMIKGEPRPSTNRIAFTTWKHWHKDSPLQPSGLLGPVVVRTYVSAPVN